MSKDVNGSYVIPTLLAGAALYFGLNKKSNILGNLAHKAVELTIQDQLGKDATIADRPRARDAFIKPKAKRKK
jgi:hypothetical protein